MLTWIINLWHHSLPWTCDKNHIVWSLMNDDRARDALHWWWQSSPGSLSFLERRSMSITSWWILNWPRDWRTRRRTFWGKHGSSIKIRDSSKKSAHPKSGPIRGSSFWPFTALGKWRWTRGSWWTTPTLFPTWPRLRTTFTNWSLTWTPSRSS